MAAPFVVSAAGYTLCSSMLMVVNKLALLQFPFPSTLMAAQFASSALVVRLLGAANCIQVDSVQIDKLKQFWLVPLVFELCIFANMKLLHASSVETTIVVRTLVPLVTSVADYIFMGRELPSTRSLIGLVIVIFGAAGYMLSRIEVVKIDVPIWAFLYVVVLSFEMVYVKHVINTVQMSTWTLVYYNNLLAFFYWPPLLLIDSEYARIGGALGILLNSSATAWIVFLSCVLGLGISFAGFGLRSLVTATTFTVLGIMNKIISVLTSIAVFHAAANRAGVASLFMCIIGGALYRQAPGRALPALSAGQDGEVESLLKPTSINPS